MSDVIHTDHTASRFAAGSLIGRSLRAIHEACPPWLLTPATVLGVVLSIFTNLLFIGDFAVRHLAAAASQPTEPLFAVHEIRRSCSEYNSMGHRRAPLRTELLMADAHDRMRTPARHWTE